MRIHLLEPTLANMIAAGEVIERPASVVKELLENSLDANASSIDIVIEQGGFQCIRITDDGNGIHRDDLVLALSRHGTSKIRTQEDLTHINTKGFRGEALASILAVSRIKLSSKMHDEKQGYKVEAEGFVTKNEVEPCCQLSGTTIEIRDIFFNTPARRKFLRSEKTEMQHIEDVIKRLALSAFNIRFSFHHNQQRVFMLPKAETEMQREQRVAKLCGKKFIDNALKMESEINGLKISGWVSNATRSQGDLQYFYVNGRMVRDKLINHAIRSAYELTSEDHPAYVLYLEIDPTLVDVNVHPTKAEVRFSETRLVHDFIVQALREALSSGFFIKEDLAKKEETGNYEASYASPKFPRFKMEETRGFYANDIKENFATKALAKFHDKYLLAETTEGLLILDLFAQQKNKWLETLRENNNLNSHQFSVPATKKFNQSELNDLQRYSSELKTFGFELDILGEDTLIIRAMPEKLKECDVLPDIVHCLKTHGQKEFPWQHFIAVLAHHLAHSEANNHGELEELLKDVDFSKPLPSFCMMLSRQDLQKLSID